MFVIKQKYITYSFYYVFIMFSMQGIVLFYVINFVLSLRQSICVTPTFPHQ